MDPAQSETLSMRGNSLHGNREIPDVPSHHGGGGRPGKAHGRTPGTHASGKSDDRVVPRNPSNKAEPLSAAERAEGRRSAKGNTEQTATCRTQSRAGVSIGLQGVREAARRDRRARFTSLLHHVSVPLLRASFFSLQRDAAPGVDGRTWREYEVDMESQLRDLHERVHRGTYRAQPSKRTYIPKPDGRRRPLGIAALEDKIVQHAVVQVLNCIYEVDFEGFSYGFRPGRSQHDALDALWVALMRRKVNWVLDADIRGFFDAIDHGWMMKFLEHRIADRRVLRLIQKWLRAGVSENGSWSRTTRGTPQGAVISPLLANVYLHYALDLWVQEWRRHRCSGDAIIVRYADDFVLGFQHRLEAVRFQRDLAQRLRRFGLELHPDKTRLIEFGRFAAARRARQALGKPETFDFLGFTHYCGWTQARRRFFVWRKTSRNRLRAKLKQIRLALLRRRHLPVRVVGAWLRGVVQGYLNYHAVPGNCSALDTFVREVERSWLLSLRRRSQRHRMPWRRFTRIAKRWLPRPTILHPYPGERFHAKHPRQEPYAGNLHVRICAGGRP